MEDQYLYPIYRPVEDVDGKAEVRPVVWLMTPEKTPRMLVTVAQVARLLSVDVDQVQALIERGAFHVVDVAGDGRIPLTDLAEYVHVRSLEAGPSHEHA